MVQLWECVSDNMHDEWRNTGKLKFFILGLNSLLLTPLKCALDGFKLRFKRNMCHMHYTCTYQAIDKTIL